MKMKRNGLLFLLIAATIVSGCGCSGKTKSGNAAATKTDAAQTEVAPTKFPFVEVPPTITDQNEGINYFIEHYWDNFDFADLSYIESEALNEGVAYYVMSLSNVSSEETARKSLGALMRSALADRDMFYTIYDGVEYFLSYPNSEIRNNDLYIIFLESILAIEELEPEERIAPAEDLRLAKMNLVGEAANDFYYTLESGKEYNMHSIKADYLLVYFYNLGCPMCRDITEFLGQLLSQNPTLSRLLGQNRLKVLMIYPPVETVENELENWLAHKNEVPAMAGVIDSYDKRGALYSGEKYDLRAIPSLYLLDKNKKVILRDFVDPLEMVHAIDRIESAK